MFKNTKILIITLLIIFILLLAVYLLNKPKEQASLPEQPIPTFIASPTPDSPGPAPGGVYSYSSPEDEKQRAEQEIVVALIKKLPFEGQNFSLEYHFSSDQFLLTFPEGKETEAKEELDLFLKQNRIPDRSWLKKIVQRIR